MGEKYNNSNNEWMNKWMNEIEEKKDTRWIGKDVTINSNFIYI